MIIKKVKVAVVDDSAFMRKIIRDSLESRGFEVVATGRNGADAVDVASKGVADVMTLDVQMPVMNGLEALRKIMRSFPMPVVMVSSLTTKDARPTIEALSSGAFDFIAKPGGAISLDFNSVADELAEKLLLAHASGLSNSRKQSVQNRAEPSAAAAPARFIGRYDIMIVGSSTGGPKALDYLIPKLPGRFPVPIVIVQHMPPKFTATLSQRLNDESKIRVFEVTDRIDAEPSTAYVATGDRHLEILDDGSGITFRPVDGPKLNGVRPSVDHTLLSLSKTSLKALCVILTGMGRDGTEGLKAVGRDRMTVITESEKTAVVYGMPKSVVNAGLSDYSLSLDEIAGKISELILQR